MEEEPFTPQVLSSAILSICAVISNYWSLIEVHGEYSLTLPLSVDEYPPLTYYTKWHSWRSDMSSQSPFSAPLLLLLQPLWFEETAGPLWCMTVLRLDHIHCCFWQGIYSRSSQGTKITSIQHHASHPNHRLPLLFPNTLRLISLSWRSKLQKILAWTTAYLFLNQSKEPGGYFWYKVIDQRGIHPSLWCEYCFEKFGFNQLVKLKRG